MLFIAVGVLALLLYREGYFSEMQSFMENRLLDEHVMEALDDAHWEDRMVDFEQTHPGLTRRPYISLGRKKVGS